MLPVKRGLQSSTGSNTVHPAVARHGTRTHINEEVMLPLLKRHCMFGVLPRLLSKQWSQATLSP